MKSHVMLKRVRFWGDVGGFVAAAGEVEVGSGERRRGREASPRWRRQAELILEKKKDQRREKMEEKLGKGREGGPGGEGVGGRRKEEGE